MTHVSNACVVAPIATSCVVAILRDGAGYTRYRSLHAQVAQATAQPTVANSPWPIRAAP